MYFHRVNQKSRNPQVKLDLSNSERSNLRKHKIKKSVLIEFSSIQLSEILGVDLDRAVQLRALVDFQRIPTIGIRFAEDLVFMGFYSLEELEGQSGARQLEYFERKKGYRIDSCVEDQFRLAVHFAEHQDCRKTWWDFSEERKSYSKAKGYPSDRPYKHRYEM